MPQIESIGLLGSLGRERGYTGINTGDSGKLKVRSYSLNLANYILQSEVDKTWLGYTRSADRT
jgi:hypothetical protein